MNLCRDVVICGISSFICLYLVNFPVVLCLIWEDDSYVLLFLQLNPSFHGLDLGSWQLCFTISTIKSVVM